MSTSTIFLTLGQITLDERLQHRVGGLDESHVNGMTELLQEDANLQLPPVCVMLEGVTYWLWDGFHTVDAYRRAGRQHVPVSIKDGTFKDAWLLSLGANGKHGKPRSQQDKENVLRVAFTDPLTKNKSDREIARLVGLGDRTVNRYRAKLSASCDADAPREVTRGGKTYTMATGAIGKPTSPQEVVADDLIVDRERLTLETWEEVQRSIVLDGRAWQGLTHQDDGTVCCAALWESPDSPGYYHYAVHCHADDFYTGTTRALSILSFDKWEGPPRVACVLKEFETLLQNEYCLGMIDFEWQQIPVKELLFDISGARACIPPWWQLPRGPERDKAHEDERARERESEDRLSNWKWEFPKEIGTETARRYEEVTTKNP